jgi:hypothetical protein
VISRRKILGIVNGTLENSTVDDAQRAGPLSRDYDDPVSPSESIEVTHDSRLSIGHRTRQLEDVRAVFAFY